MLSNKIQYNMISLPLSLFPPLSLFLSLSSSSFFLFQVGNDVWMVNAVDSGERAMEYLKGAAKNVSAPEIIIIDQVNYILFYFILLFEVNL